MICVVVAICVRPCVVRSLIGCARSHDGGVLGPAVCGDPDWSGHRQSRRCRLPLSGALPRRVRAVARCLSVLKPAGQAALRPRACLDEFPGTLRVIRFNGCMQGAQCSTIIHSSPSVSHCWPATTPPTHQSRLCSGVRMRFDVDIGSMLPFSQVNASWLAYYQMAIAVAPETMIVSMLYTSHTPLIEVHCSQVLNRQRIPCL